MKYLEHLVRVLWDPASYVDPWRAATLSIRQRQTANALLVRQHCLGEYIPSGAEQSLLARALVNSWWQLERVAFLLGCARALPHLAGDRTWMLLDGDTHRFLSTAPHCVMAHLLRVPGEGVVAIAERVGRQRMSALAHTLPAWLSVRLRLRFSGDGEIWNKDDSVGLWSALRHVARAT